MLDFDGNPGMSVIEGDKTCQLWASMWHRPHPHNSSINSRCTLHAELARTANGLYDENESNLREKRFTSLKRCQMTMIRPFFWRLKGKKDHESWVYIR